MNRPWMPLYIGDYLRDTAHLRAAESGAYLHLIMAYWQAGGLPNDDRQLATIARMSDAEWKRAKPVLARFFGPGFGSHKRIDAELAHALAVSSKRSASARQRHAPAEANVPAIVTANAPANAPPMPVQKDPHAGATSPPQPLSPSPSESSPRSDEARVPSRNGRRKPETGCPVDWVPSDDGRAYAAAKGLTGADVAREAERFVNHARQNDRRCADWSAAWRNWCIKAAEMLGRTPPPPPGAAVRAQVFVRTDTPQWEAWRRHSVAAGGRSPPTNRDGGWWFETEWPPGHGAEAERKDEFAAAKP